MELEFRSALMMKHCCAESTTCTLLNDARGFTIIELVIAMVMTVLLGGAMLTNYIVQQRAAVQVRQAAEMQQQLRGAITVMAEDIRLAGFNRKPGNPSPEFGILSVQRWSIGDETSTPVLDVNGSESIWLAYDFDRFRPNTESNALYADALYGQHRCASAPLVTTDNKTADEQLYAYRLFDDNDDSVLELARDVYDSVCGSAVQYTPISGVPFHRQVVAENIEAIAFAYALDADGDGLLDERNGQTIWAMDLEDNDNKLDTNLDTNGDGLITEEDAGDDNLIDSTDNLYGVLTPDATVTVDKIRAVRIWLLAGSQPDTRYNDSKKYVVGDRIIDPATMSSDFSPHRRRVLMVHTVDCRNMWPPNQM